MEFEEYITESLELLQELRLELAKRHDSQVKRKRYSTVLRLVEGGEKIKERITNGS